MVVGVLKISLLIGESRSLKDKRRVVRSILDRTRGRFNVSAAEVEDNDLLQRAGLGFTAVSNDAEFASSVLSAVGGYVESLGLAQVLDAGTEIIHL